MSYKELRKKISSVLVFALLFGMLAPAMAFGAEAVKLKDIADSYAKTEIQALVDAGIVSGYEDGSFQPTKAMTRAELAKIIVLALGKKENPDKAASFTDVDKNSWYRGYVGALVESGITDGTSATTFSPDAKVTREELVVFFVRAMGLEETAKKVAADAKLSDLAQVSSWAKAHVSLAFKMGFVQGIENSNGTLSFNPKANAERQALARLAYEFKTNKAKFVEKAQAIAKAEEKPSTGGSTGTTTGGGGGFGGGGGYVGGGSNNASVADRLKAGETITGDVTLGAGEFGPTDGKTAKITGKLTLDPGATGSVTLRNIEAAEIIVASGASESVHLANVKITVKLTVRASNQTVAVRVVVEGNTTIKATEVTSQAIIKNSTSNRDAFGGITVNPSVAGQNIAVEGAIGTITVNGKITLNAAAGSDIGSIQLNSANANISLSGTGTIQTLVAAVAGAVLNILDNSVNLQGIQIKAKLKFEGENTKNRIKDIPIDVPSGSNLSDLIDSVIDGIMDAIKLAIAKDDLNIKLATGDTASSVTKDVYELPTSGTNGAVVTWSSSNPSVISATGVVTRPAVGQADAVVTLTATITLGSLQTTKTFKLTVKAYTDTNAPVSAAPAAADVHLVNYAQGADEAHVVGVVAGAKVRIYDANNSELGSAMSQLEGTQLIARVIVSNGFSATASKVYAAAQESGKLESSKVEVSIPAIPDAPTGVVLNKDTNGDVIVTVPNTAGKIVFVYTSADARSNVTGTEVVGSDGSLNIVIPASKLTGVSKLYVAFFVNGGESARVEKVIPTGGGNTPDTTAPGKVFDTSITVAAKTTNSITLNWIPSTDDRPGTVSYAVYMNDVKLDTVTGTTYTATGLSAGTSYMFKIYAIDEAGNVAEPGYITVTTAAVADTTAPSPVTDITSTATTNSITLNWTASTDDRPGTVSYAVYMEGTKLNTVTATTYTATGLSASTSYAFAVYAIDEAGNVAAPGTTTVTTAVVADTTAPSPVTDITSTATTNSVTLNWTASTDDRPGTVSYAVYMEGTKLNTVTATTYTATGLSASTSYTFAVYAIDEAGNVAAPGTTTVTTAAVADTTAPSPVTDITSTATTNSITLNWTASTDDRPGTVSYAVYMEGTKLNTVTATTYTATGLSASTSYAFAVYAIDEAGNVAAPGTTTVTTAATTPGTVTGYVYASDFGNTYNVTLKGATVKLLSDPSISTTTNSDGSFTLNGVPAGNNLKLKVEYGNAGGTSASFNVVAGQTTVFGEYRLTMSTVTSVVYAVYSSKNAAVTDNVYGLSVDGDAYDNSAYPENNYLVVKFSDSLAADSVNGTLDFSNVTVSGLSGVTASVYNSVYLKVYAPDGFPSGTTELTINGVLKSDDSLQNTYIVNPVTVKVKE